MYNVPLPPPFNYNTSSSIPFPFRGPQHAASNKSLVRRVFPRGLVIARRQYEILPILLCRSYVTGGLFGRV